jgi:hypothetical protein
MLASSIRVEPMKTCPPVLARISHQLLLRTRPSARRGVVATLSILGDLTGRLRSNSPQRLAPRARARPRYEAGEKHGLALVSALLGLGAFSACRPAPAANEPPELVIEQLAPGTPVRFAGELSLGGELADATRGAVFVSVRHPTPPGRSDAPPLLMRRYEIGDPAWSRRDGLSCLYFSLGLDDALPAAHAPVLGRTMVLEVRFDPDGNPATEEKGGARRSATVTTGDGDLLIVVDPARATIEGATARGTDTKGS